MSARCVRYLVPFALLAVLGLVALLHPGAAHADTILNPASGGITLGEGNNSQVTNYRGVYPLGETFSYSGSDSTGTMSGSSAYGVDPQVSASFLLSGTLDAGQEFVSESSLSYQFVIAGPGNQMAQIAIIGSGQESISTGGTNAVQSFAQNALVVAAAGVGTVTPTNALFYADPCSGNLSTMFCSGGGTTSGSFNVSTTLEVMTNTVYNVTILAEINLDSITGDSTPLVYSGQATVDPTITLDTTNPAYSLDVSPAPTPEPGSVWLALTGMLAIFGAGLAKRRFDSCG